MNEFLTIDIGNTKAKYAVFNDKNIVETNVFDPLSDDLEKLLKQHPYINKGIISSVGGKVDECLAQLKNIEMIVLSSKTKLPFALTYREKTQIGADRLALVAAAYAEKPHQNSLVIDIGTCITYDILTADDRHLGGPIKNIFSCWGNEKCCIFAAQKRGTIAQLVEQRTENRLRRHRRMPPKWRATRSFI